MMGPLEFSFQFSGVEILAEVGQALLEFQEGITYVLFVGEKNIAPHGVGARGDSGHLFEGAPSCVEQGGILAVFVYQSRGQGRGDQLREVTDPGTELVVFIGLHAGDASADFFYPLEKISGDAFVDFLIGGRSYKPSRPLE